MIAGACLKWRKSSGRRGKDKEGTSVNVKWGVEGEGDGLKTGANKEEREGGRGKGKEVREDKCSGA